MNVAIWSLVPLPFPSHISGSSWFTYCWSLAWSILIITLLECEMSAIVHILWHCPSLGLEWKQVFSSLWPQLNFPNLLIYWVWHFSSIIFYNLNSLAGIISPPLALFIAMLPKAHLTSHSRMSGSRWVIIPLWLSGSWRSLLYSLSVYSCHLLISSASVRSIPLLSFIEPIFAWNIPLVSLIFLKRSLVFPILAVIHSIILKHSWWC